jgi:hypothetical protein
MCVNCGCGNRPGRRLIPLESHMRAEMWLTLSQAREVVIIATGAAKAFAVKKCVEEGVSHMWTASCLQNHPCAMFVVDDDATLEMQMKTVKVCIRSINPGAQESRPN